ncbi:MAG: V-type ATP synthase subunit D [Promethearchaeota archaeon]|nr:MAG: V-type ATP synthase subunit D [Candidatus Lokiarchaeota archaeon]
MNLQERLEFVKKGEEFLEYKREQLIQKIRNIWTDYKRQRRNFYNSLRECVRKLTQVYRDMGKEEFTLISKISEIQFKPEIDISFVKKIGIIIPRIDYQLQQEEQLPPYSFENTSPHLEELIVDLKKLFEDIIILAETEDVLLNYATNFRKVNRRINGLKNIFRPELKERIKKISNVLEEIERESFIRLKKTKEMLESNK